MRTNVRRRERVVPLRDRGELTVDVVAFRLELLLLVLFFVLLLSFPRLPSSSRHSPFSFPHSPFSFPPGHRLADLAAAAMALRLSAAGGFGPLASDGWWVSGAAPPHLRKHLILAAFSRGGYATVPCGDAPGEGNVVGHWPNTADRGVATIIVSTAMIRSRASQQPDFRPCEVADRSSLAPLAHIGWFSIRCKPCVPISQCGNRRMPRRDSPRAATQSLPYQRRGTQCRESRNLLFWRRLRSMLSQPRNLNLTPISIIGCDFYRQPFFLCLLVFWN